MKPSSAASKVLTTRRIGPKAKNRLKHSLMRIYLDDALSEESYKRLILMSVCIWRNYKKNEGADVGKELLNLLEDEVRMMGIVAQMMEDGEWEIRATRPFQGPGARTKKERMRRHLESARTMIQENCAAHEVEPASK
jgi:hypothetical protein